MTRDADHPSPPPLTDAETTFADRVSEAQDLVNQGHTISGDVLHRSLGASSPALQCAALALNALQEAVPSAAAPELAEGDRVGDCEIRGVIGRGGMGTVYDAVELPGGNAVALKVLSPALAADTEALLRFKREAELAGKLEHPHVVTVLGAGEHDSLLYFKMERVEGGSLQEELERARDAEDELPDAETCRALAGRFAGLADALEAAHRAGVIHRDVKPGNILMGDGEQLRLVDFGIARAAGAQTLTATSAILGTPLYMAPEQALGRTREVGPATDVYGLGATLYEAVTRQPIFDPTDGYAGLITRILEQPPRSPRRLNRAVPKELETVIARCLEKRPAARYASAAELRDDLTRVAERRPVRAHRVGTLKRLGRRLRRQPLLASTAVGLLSTAVLIAAFVLQGSGSSFAEQASVGWIGLRQDAWIQLFGSNDTPALARMAGKMTEWQPTSQDEAEEGRLLRAWIEYKRLEPATALEILGDPAPFKSEKAARILRSFIVRADWRFPEARAEAERAEALPARSRLDHALHALYLTADQGDREGGREAIETLVEACPDYLPARIVQTEILKSAGDTKGAVAACGTLLLMRPNNSALLLLRGVIYRNARRFEKAERDFRAAVEADPKNEEARVSLYYLLGGGGEAGREEAAKVLAAGLAENPRSRWLLNARGWRRQGQGDLTGAVADYRAALRVDSRFGLAQINLGNALIRLNRREEALEVWQRILDEPDQPTAGKAAILNERAVHRFDRGEKEAGYADLRRALEVRYRPLVHDNLANYLMVDARYSEAEHELNRLLRLVPSHQKALARRGKCRLWTGNLEGARADFEKALGLWGERAPGWVCLIRAELAILADPPSKVTTALDLAAKKQLRTVNRLWLEEIRADWLLDLPDREDEARAALKRWKSGAPRDPAVERTASVAALRVRLAARAPGQAALTAWKDSPLPALKPNFLGGHYERLRVRMQLGFPASPSTEPQRRLAKLVRERTAGNRLEATDLREMPAAEDARAAWMLGEAWLSASRPREALPLLERAARDLDLGTIWLDVAVARALTGDSEGAGAALERALAAGVPRWPTLRRLAAAGIAIDGPIRRPLLEAR